MKLPEFLVVRIASTVYRSIQKENRSGDMKNKVFTMQIELKYTTTSSVVKAKLILHLGRPDAYFNNTCFSL